MADFNANSGPPPHQSSLAISPPNPRISLSQPQEGASPQLDSAISTPSDLPSASEVHGQPQRFAASGRSRGKSVSISASAITPANLLRPPNVPTQPDTPGQASTTSGIHLTTHCLETPTGSSASQPLSLLCSPVSPHRAKPRRGVPHELSSECSETSSLDSLPILDISSDHARTAGAHVGRGLHRPPFADECGTENRPAGAGSFETESENDVAETESPAGSTRTEAGSSAASDSISDCSNSDVEIYLETHGLDDSAMRMNCVGQHTFTEADTSSRQGIDSPVLPNTGSQSRGDGTIYFPGIASSIVTHSTEVTQATTIHVPTQTRADRDDAEGWVTNLAKSTNQQQQKHVGSISRAGAIPPAAQHGESVRLQAEGQESGNYGVSSLLVDNKRHVQDAPSTSAYPPFDQPSTKENQADKFPRTTSDLKPTSVDFKPRMAIELKPPLVEFKPAGIGFNPVHATFTANQPSSDRVLVSTTRSTFSQQDVDHSFQSNRAAPDHGSHMQRSAGRPDDTVYLDQLQPSVAHDVLQPDLSLEHPSGEDDGLEQKTPFDDSHKTPNVYINGLPPHFPEDHLYALAAPFGEVKSVRTFTRHVRDSESGYGFVLFENIESAERCILSLRKYRNLHPTFSKQIHKIPGTAYAQNIAHTPSESMHSLDSWDSGRDESDSFKKRMEGLHDPSSTNLYMEGLPLSIDEPTLAALVSPHRISSSRFFQTRLSHPPRIIAFVRLETRTGAEEVIERLHGRMVRGWNDTGSRISVRFADTAEQRELRRSERATKEGDNTASQLTIAQAALLNLRGQEIRQAAKINTLPVIGERRRHAADYSYNDFSSNSIQLPAPQIPQPVFEVDYSLAPGRSIPAQRMQSPSGLIHPGHAQQYSRPAPRSVDPSMAILLDNLRNNGAPFRGSNVGHYDAYPQQHNLAIQSQQYPPDDYTARQPPAHAKSGYTATEEFIMRAHAESRRRPAAPLEPAHHARNRRENELEAATANIATGVRGYRTRAAAITLDRKSQSSTLTGIEPVSMMNEDEFHAAAARGHDDQSQRVQNIGEQDPDATVRAASREYNPRSSQVVRQNTRAFHTPVLPPQAQFVSTAVTEQHHNQHVRSTTFPHRPAPNQHQRHQQHNSMSVPSTGQRTPQHASTAVMGQCNLVHDKHDYQETLEKQTLRREVGHKLHSKLQHAPNVTSLHQNSYEMDSQPSPSLISPTLTYSSQTPSTLSPATPFFGSFNSQNEGFDRNNGLDGKKLRAAGGH